MIRYLHANRIRIFDSPRFAMALRDRAEPQHAPSDDGDPGNRRPAASNGQETVHMAFRGKPPGSGAGDISKRSEALRPAILLTAKQAAEARTMRRAGRSADEISAAMNQPLDEVEKVLVQMRMPRPETTRGTLNVTLAAHRLIMRERQGDEPIWTTVDRLLDELLRLRQGQVEQGQAAPSPHRRSRRQREADAPLPLLAGLE